MSKIVVLDEATANKIAAGEVVERPCSVVKELIENAIDAHSSKIEIEIIGGGLSFIRVTDNGLGMERDDAVLSIQRHATSKLRAIGDLQNLSTLGFRGEALPTIASVSRFSLLTRSVQSDLAKMLPLCGVQPADFSDAAGAVCPCVWLWVSWFVCPPRDQYVH